MKVTCTKLGEDRTRSSWDMLANRQTDRCAHHNTPQQGRTHDVEENISDNSGKAIVTKLRVFFTAERTKKNY